jgi:3D (Asp-Asp-Asp) domain-containing protein
MRKIKKKVAGVIVVSMLVGSNVVSLAAYDRQINKISEYKEVNENRIRQLEENNRSLRDEVFDKNNQLHKQVEEIEKYKIDIQDLKKKNEKLKRELRSVKSRPSKPTHQVQVSRGEIRSNNIYRFEVTAYTAGFESTGKSPDHPEYGLTASGKYVKEGTTIACPPSIPFGTEMKIEGVGYRVCQDRGSDIVSGRLDVYMQNLSAAQSFGRQSLMVQVMN